MMLIREVDRFRVGESKGGERAFNRLIAELNVGKRNN